jgi:hypothetical protein
MKNAELDADFKTFERVAKKIYSAKNFYCWVQKFSAYDYNSIRLTYRNTELTYSQLSLHMYSAHPAKIHIRILKELGNLFNLKQRTPERSLERYTVA